MSTLSPNPFRPHRPGWVGPFLASLPVYARRLLMYGFVFPCALPLALVAVLNLGSFAGIAQTFLQMAAGTGNDATRIHFRTCADPEDLTRAKLSPATCSAYREEDLPIPVLAARVAPQIRILYLLVVFTTFGSAWVFGRPTPFGQYLHANRPAKKEE
ncbi:hypothetical protein [Burkholderia gladioli]|uniref:hypothetical protein n=1 Tax=Burkholderia gladioli TaxID=28095 RepID=UPI00163F281B|nr:hypothetical protein [Burkholderia gladioli]